MPTIIKPRKLGILTKVERRGPRASLVVSALGLFSLTEPTDFEFDTALWPMAIKEMPPGAILDMAMPKPCGEVLFAGRAMAPWGEAVPAMAVDVSVGAMRKRIAVFGDRVWRPAAGGVVFTGPKPFVEMPLAPEHAFGGPGHADNPAGRGFEAERRVEAGEIVPLPNIEDATRPIRSASDNPAPVRPGPLDPAHPSRRALAGTYDDHWLKHDFPGLARDADPRLFCMAAQDQRIAGYFAGDEPFRVTGFQAQRPDIAGTLPGMRVRIFVKLAAQPASLVELPSVIDTVWLFPSAGKGVLIYRGACPVADVEGDDASHVMIAYERLSDEPRTLAHYLEVFRLRTDPQQSFKYVLADAQLSPEPDPAVLARRKAAREAHAAAQMDKTERAQELVMRDALARAGLPDHFMPALPKPEPMPFLMPTPEEIESGEVDLAELFEGIEALTAKTTKTLDEIAAKSGSQIQAVERFRNSGDVGDIDALLATLDLPEPVTLADQVSLPPDFVMPAASADDDRSLREASGRFFDLPEFRLLAPAHGGIEQALGAITEPPDAPPPEPPDAPLDTTPMTDLPPPPSPPRDPAAMARLAAAFPGLAKPDGSIEALLEDLLGEKAPAAPAVSPDARETLAGASARLTDAEPKIVDGLAALRRLAPEPAFPLQPLSPAVADRFGQVVAAEARRTALAGRDMAGANLAGQSFAGLDLTGAFFERCDLRGADFTGARCGKAVFAGADLRDANFSGAVLAEANLGSVDARGTRFLRADLTKAQMLKIKLTGADLSGALLEDINFIESDLSDVRLVGAQLKQVVAIRLSMARIDLSQAVLESCSFVEIEAEGLVARGMRAFKLTAVKLKAPGADFTGASLQQCGFHAGCDLRSSRFDDALGMNGAFRAALIAGGSFVGASFNRVDFGEADLTGANLRLASLKQSVLTKARLAQADLFGANLFNAQARRTDFTGARLRGANLYGCDLTDAVLLGADLSRANLDKTIFGVATDAA
jgi:uncharacterized protein YjbI with pentapeptide repeats